MTSSAEIACLEELFFRTTYTVTHRLSVYTEFLANLQGTSCTYLGQASRVVAGESLKDIGARIVFLSYVVEKQEEEHVWVRKALEWVR